MGGVAGSIGHGIGAAGRGVYGAVQGLGHRLQGTGSGTTPAAGTTGAPLPAKTPYFTAQRAQNIGNPLAQGLQDYGKEQSALAQPRPGVQFNVAAPSPIEAPSGDFLSAAMQQRRKSANNSFYGG